MASDPGQAPRALALGWWAWLLLALAWFATLGGRALLDPDEGRYAEIPREMLASGDWVTPRFNDLKYFEKPPLQYWATAAIYAAAGVSPWSSRLWGVGLAFACLPLVYFWTRRLYGAQAALAALGALAVSPFYLVVGHLNLLDQAFTFFLTAAVLSFAWAQVQPPGAVAERRGMLLAWACAALAVLSKGIVVGVLAGGALVLYTLIERDGRTWRRLHVLPGAALLLLIALPWFVLVSRRNPSFPGFFFVHEHFARFLTTVHQRVEPWWFFLPLLLLAVLPWLPAAVRGVRAAWTAGAAPGEFRPLRFLAVYAAVTLAFFSASGSKLAPYILPLVPVLAVLAGVAVRDLRSFARFATVSGATLVVIVATGLLIYSARRNAFVPSAAIALSVAAAIAALAGLLLARLPRLGERTALAGAALAALLAWQFLLCAYSVVPPARSAAALVAAVRPQIAPATQLYSVGQYRETISPYLGRTLRLAAYEGELAFGLSEEPARRMSLEQFGQAWGSAGAAVAFFEPEVWDRLRREGLPGRVIAADEHTVAVSRQ